MKCPFHVGTEMLAVSASAPITSQEATSTEYNDMRANWSTDGKGHSKPHTRKVWRCPVPGCPKVFSEDEPRITDRVNVVTPRSEAWWRRFE